MHDTHRTRELAEAVERARPRLRAVAERILRDPTEAEDAVQDAVLSALRRVDGFRGEALLSTWLYRITVNAALMRLRKRRRSESHAPDWIEARRASAGEAEPGAHARCEAGQALDRTWAGMERLPRHYRRALMLRAVEGRSTAEVAAALRTSPNGVKILVHRARKALRGALADA